MTFNIDQTQIIQGVNFCLHNARKLAEEAKILVDKSPSRALALYIFSIEEYGKSIWLNEYLIANNFEIPEVIFGGQGSHKKKIEKAESKLKEHNLHLFYRIESTDDPNYTDSFYYEDKPQIKSNPPGLSISDHSTISGPRHANFDVRKDCFHIGWDIDTNQWKRPTKIIGKLLEPKIDELIDYLNIEIKISENNNTDNKE